MMKLHRKIAIFLAFLIVPAIIFAKTSEKGATKSKSMLYEISLKQSTSSPVLDGVLSPNEWKNAAVISNFTQKDPAEGMPSSEPTFVLITYDKNNIYFGIRCFDHYPNKIVANEMRRDYDLSNNDYVEIVIDTYHDQRNAFYFATNSLGARLDCEIKTEGEHINWEWDGIWRSDARKDELGWTAEVAIPFKTLRFDKHKNLTWGINFGRYIPRKREESFWSPISRNDDFKKFGKFKASKFGILRGIRNIQTNDRLQLKPYSIGGLEQNRDPATFNQNRNSLADIGLDGKYRLTSNLVTDLTINTDFAQVESDVEQVNLSRFSLFFPEKRDFFIEGLDMFNIGESNIDGAFTRLFFSRQIGLHRDAETFELKKTPIIGGVKLTGKEGAYEVGFLNVLTNGIEYTNLNNTHVKIPKTNYAAFRVKRDVLKRSYIGFMGLSKDEFNHGTSNRTFAVDGVFAFDNNITVKGYLAKTHTPGLPGKDLNGHIDAGWGDDLFSVNGSFTDIGENFNPEMGFLQWTDIRKYHTQFNFNPRPKIFNTRQSFFSSDLEFITDHNNVLQFRTLFTSLYNQFNNNSYVYASYINYYDNVPAPGFALGQTFVPTGIYHYDLWSVGYGSDRSRKISGSVFGGGGSFYTGKFWSLNAASFLRPTNRISLDLNWEWDKVDVPFKDGTFTTNLLSARFNYSFSTELFAKAYVQWNSFDARVISNILLNYKYSPGSDFYLVYNEEWNTLGSINTVNRTVIAKLTYLLDFHRF